MKIYLTNSLTKNKEEFVPIDKNCVTMYACGPTVYNRPHLGNARAAVVYDILFRLLKQLYPEVIYARNITDVDDKIINASLASGEDIKSITSKFTNYYHEDVAAVGCLMPTIEPTATSHIPQMIEMIKALIQKEHAYVAQGHVLFSVESFGEYGKLSGRSVEEMIAGARVEVAPFKKHPADFVLWKPAKLGEEAVSFDSPWGRGRPGWHIECSAMSKEHLGSNFDIHGGGADLIFPHHENEVAQSTCANSVDFANYWVHNGFLTVDGEKMSKSLGNFKTVREAIEEGIDGMVIRYLFFKTHYRKPLDYNQYVLQEAQKSINKFQNAMAVNKSSVDSEILRYLCDDLNTPLVITRLHELADFAAKGDKEDAETLSASLEFLGFYLRSSQLSIPQEIIDLADIRAQAKQIKDWQRADEIRQKIECLGYKIKDEPNGYKILIG